MDSTKTAQFITITFEIPFTNTDYYVNCIMQSINVAKSSIIWIDWTVFQKTNESVKIAFWNEKSTSLSLTEWVVIIKPYL